MSLKKSLIVLLITAAITLVGNLVRPHINPIEALPGALILVAIAFIGIVLAKVIPIKLPAVAYVVTLAVLISIPSFPGSETIVAMTKKVDFLALTTPILAYAGIYTGKNLDSLKKTGWRIIVLSLFIITGTYLFSAIIAEIVLRIIGQI